MLKLSYKSNKETCSHKFKNNVQHFQNQPISSITQQRFYDMGKNVFVKNPLSKREISSYIFWIYMKALALMCYITCAAADFEMDSNTNFDLLMCLCMCECLHVQVCLCACAHSRVCMPMYRFVCVCAGVNVCIHACEHVGSALLVSFKTISISVVTDNADSNIRQVVDKLPRK